MNLKSKFPLQSKVAMTAYGLSQFPDYEGHTAVVMGYGRNKHSIRVLFDHHRCVSNWHHELLEHVEAVGQQTRGSE